MEFIKQVIGTYLIFHTEIYSEKLLLILAQKVNSIICLNLAYNGINSWIPYCYPFFVALIVSVTSYSYKRKSNLVGWLKKRPSDNSKYIPTPIGQIQFTLFDKAEARDIIGIYSRAFNDIFLKSYGSKLSKTHLKNILQSKYNRIGLFKINNVVEGFYLINIFKSKHHKIAHFVFGAINPKVQTPGIRRQFIDYVNEVTQAQINICITNDEGIMKDFTNTSYGLTYPFDIKYNSDRGKYPLNSLREIFQNQIQICQDGFTSSIKIIEPKPYKSKLGKRLVEDYNYDPKKQNIVILSLIRK